MKSRGFCFRSICVLSIGLTVGLAKANPNDALQFFAGYGVVYDDNLFRLRPGTNAQQTIGRDSAAETIKTATAAVGFDKKYGLQRIRARLTAVDYQYQNFDYLDFTALNFVGLVNWSFTPKASGVVGIDRQQLPSGFEDFKRYTIRNQATVINGRAEGFYELDGAWQVTGAFLHLDVKNAATIIQQRAFTRESVQVGLKRTFGSESEVAYRIRSGSGDYSDTANSAAAFLPNGFDDIENEFQLKLVITPKSSLAARISYLQKKFHNFAFRDYSGITGDATFIWGLTDRTSIQFIASSLLSDYQTTYSNSVRAVRYAIMPTIQIKEKVAVKLRQEYVQRSFDGVVSGFSSALKRDDNTHLTRVSVDWDPREQLGFSFWFQKERRESNYGDFSYSSKSVGILARTSF